MLPARVRRIRSLFASPGDVWLALRVLGWALVLPGLKHLVPVRSLARVMHGAPSLSKSSNRPIVRSSISPVVSPADRIVTFARWGARLIRWRSGGNCLERGLIAFRYLGAAGANPTLVVGLGPDDRGGLIGHAWVLVDGEPAGESAASVSIYTPVFAFASDGTLIATPGEQATGHPAAGSEGRAT